MFEHYTENAKRTIFFAKCEAGQWGSREIDPEHILLALLRDEDSTRSERLEMPGCAFS